MVCARAHELAQQYDARLSLIHVVEPVLPAPPYELPGVMPMDLEQELMEQAKRRMKELAQRHNLPEQAVSVEAGPTTSTIVTFADEHDIDLIVIGSHGRHGVGLLLGSTANAVLHHTKVDVLAVRVGT